MRERPAKRHSRPASGGPSLRTPPAAPAAKRKTARVRLAEKRVQLRKEARASVSPDEIVCQLCGKVYRAITYTHLRGRHELTAVTAVADYKRRFGLRVAVSAEVNALQRSVRCAYHQRRGTHWTRQRIRTELRQLSRQGAPLQASQLPSALYGAILRIIGSWDAALRGAGLDPKRHRAFPDWDDKALLDRIRRLARHGPLSNGLAKARHQALHNAAPRRFRNWGRALRAAGLDPKEHHRPAGITLQVVRAWIRSRHRSGLSIRDSDTRHALKRKVRRETGSTWAAYVESLGIPYPGGIRRLDWSREAVLAAIRRRRREGLPLNSVAVREESQALTHQARIRFGSWDAALQAAGIDPVRVRLNHAKWTRAEVITALRRRHGEGRPLRLRDVRAEEPRLAKAAQRLFPSSLARALRAAGLDPALAGHRARRR
jgi:hypothetical protein